MKTLEGLQYGGWVLSRDQSPHTYDLESIVLRVFLEGGKDTIDASCVDPILNNSNSIATQQSLRGMLSKADLLQRTTFGKKASTGARSALFLVEAAMSCEWCTPCWSGTSTCQFRLNNNHQPAADERGSHRSYQLGGRCSSPPIKPFIPLERRNVRRRHDLALRNEQIAVRS